MSDGAPSKIGEEMETFFAAYVDAFAREDADAVSEFWDPVCLFPSPAGNFALERAAFREHCATLMRFYRDQGVAQPVGELLSVAELLPNLSEARMAYRMLGPDGDLVAGWEHIYVLRKTDRWRVSLAIADDELAAWSKRGARL